MLHGFSDGDDTGCVVFPFGENDHHCAAAEHPDTNPAVFSIVVTIIQGSDHPRLEDFPSIGKVKAVFGYVDPILLFIPFESHTLHVHTKRNQVNRGMWSGNNTQASMVK